MAEADRTWTSGKDGQGRRGGYLPIEDYGVIGDLHTVALVGHDGAIDFLCFPNFDSPSVFARLLDAERGGHFTISPLLDHARHRQLYLPDTNVLLSRFLSEDGVAELSDFMPVEETGWAHNLVRRVKTVRGRLRYRMVCHPRFDYGRASHRIHRNGDEPERTVVFESQGAGGMALILRASVPLTVRDDGAVIAEFELGCDEKASFVLELAGEEPSPCADERYVADAFKSTVNYWRGWIGQSTYRGRWREMVDRSALVLKLLTSQRYGSMVAAPTFGLPEGVGGVRNWDYRYTWIRDASFTVYALSRLGLYREAGAFGRWVDGYCTDVDGADAGALQVMYGIDGRRELPEEVLDHFEGYRGSRPVRIGNAAYQQLQLDIYGELLDSLSLYDAFGRPVSHDQWESLARHVDWVARNWEREDEGIWEPRGGRKHFLYSRVMCWVAIDRGLRLAARRSLPAPVERWRAARDAIYRDVFDNFWDPKRRAFARSKGGCAQDASTLLLPLVGFISPTDPRWLSTLRAIEEELVEDSLVYRYRTGSQSGDGLTGHEGTFSICSFWYVECLSRSGDLNKARFFFEKMLGYASHLGLYSEELGAYGEHLGNFPQAFTHLALISAAYDLNRRLDEAGHTA